MNGDACDAFSHVQRLSSFLIPGGLVIFTLKLPGVGRLDDVGQLQTSVLAMAQHAGLQVLAITHLTYNRFEFTLFLEKMSPPGAAARSTE
jgi:hypothetical protein